MARRGLYIGHENRRTLIAFPGYESLVSRRELNKIKGLDENLGPFFVFFSGPAWGRAHHTLHLKSGSLGCNTFGCALGLLSVEALAWFFISLQFPLYSSPALVSDK